MAVLRECEVGTNSFLIITPFVFLCCDTDTSSRQCSRGEVRGANRGVVGEIAAALGRKCTDVWNYSPWCYILYQKLPSQKKRKKSWNNKRNRPQTCPEGSWTQPAVLVPWSPRTLLINGIVLIIVSLLIFVLLYCCVVQYKISIAVNERGL